ncbi:PIG-L deacetylase family protein [Granulicella paludicola]|uniref:PIG-L deacetylase family protein n=1 Tax=Granulicella paludicola TaxID=474951 RepID=UPI0021E08312|nr:PIG-L family deacetylase [Granulicella paludicola]
MVTSIISEPDWLQALGGLPFWHPPNTRTLILSPHPDDETLSVGGLIHSLTHAGTDVSVVAVTDGESAYEGESGLGPVRVAEQEAALAVLGVPQHKVYRLRLPDSGLHQVQSELENSLSSIVRPGMHVIAPWTGDFHPDHEVCGRAAQVAAQAAGAHLTFYFFWTWHRGTPSTLDGLSLVSFPLSDDDLAAKQDALRCHDSQLYHPSGHPILPADLLDPMQRNFEVYLPS